jgi:predicted nucleic acid-binding protein
MPDYLLDSCILIRHLRRHDPTTALLSKLALEGRVGIATISRLEIVEGMREHEREGTIQLLDSLLSYPLDAAIADLGGEFIRRYRVQGITLDKPDAIIGATAISHDLVLVTYNSKHYPMPELHRYQGLSEAP